MRFDIGGIVDSLNKGKRMIAVFESAADATLVRKHMESHGFTVALDTQLRMRISPK